MVKREPNPNPLRVSLVDDRPCRAEGAVELLGQGGALKTLVLAARSIPGPACIALDGPWGAGKSTLARAAYEELGSHPGARVVWFDPWPYERGDDVVTPLLISMKAQLGLKDTSKNLKRLASNVAKVALSFGTRALMGYWFGAGAGSIAENRSLATAKAEDFEAVWERLETFHDAVAESRKLFAQVVAEALTGEGPEARLYVFLDDLDRCLPDSVIRLIEAVKLLLCGLAAPFEDAEREMPGPEVVFVFALDRTVVGEAIMTRYPTSRRYTGETYLEKIFELSLQVPTSTRTPSRDAREVLLDLVRSDGDAFVRSRDLIEATLGGKGSEEGGLNVVAEVLSEPVFANPRVMKRTWNRLTLLLQSAAACDVVRELPRAEVTRLVAWIAGAERFASFRRFFREASRSELTELDRQLKLSSRENSRTAMEAPLTPSTFPTVGPLAELPQMIAYARLLGLNRPGSLGDWLAEQQGTPVSGQTLGHFDELLRSLGL